MMASIAPMPAARTPLAELLERQRTLATYGLTLLALAAASFLLQTIDPRLLESGVNIWVKPTKFLASIGIFALTAAWFFGYARPERRGSLPMRAAVGLILVGGSFELAYIGWQAAQGLESHFNTGSLFHTIMYALMGLFAVLLVGSTLPMAWEIARRPAAGLRRDYVAAVVIGLVLTFLLGGGLGGYMSSQLGHSVGAQGGHVPLFGWNRSGGDLRIAHFLGIHAEQAMPILGMLISGFAARTRRLLLGAGAATYAALTLAIFGQALAGRPLF
jgi:hypothetical protein